MIPTLIEVIVRALVSTAAVAVIASSVYSVCNEYRRSSIFGKMEEMLKKEESQ